MRVICLLCIVLCFGSCQYLLNREESQVIARIGDQFLTRSEIKRIGKNVDSRDSLVAVSEYIRNWAKNQLVFDQAKVNLSNENIQDFERLVEGYRRNLYSKAYLDILTNQFADTIISETEYKTFYDLRKENFRLQEDIIRLRYIHLGNELPKSYKREVTKKFKNINKNESPIDDDLWGVSSYMPYFLKDSIWLSLNSVKIKFSKLTDKDIKSSIEKENIIKIKDNNGFFLIKIIDHKPLGDYSPPSYMLPTMQQIIINKRKQIYVQQLENDLVDQAIQNKTLQIYE